MAELILTAEEKAALTWLDISDDALGKLVKKTCLAIQEVPDDATGMKKVWSMTCAMLLCNLCAEANSEVSTFTVNGLTDGDKQNGDWKVTIEQIQAAT